MKKTFILRNHSENSSGAVSWGKEISSSFRVRQAMGKRGHEELLEEEFSPRFVRRDGNHIYLYDVLDNETQLILMSLLRQATKDIMTEHASEIVRGELSDCVTLHINSPGGYAMVGFALYDYIKSSRLPIIGVVEGECTSAATLPFLACETRTMSPNSVVLIHQLSWGDIGKNNYMQDQAQNCRGLMARLRKIYMDETTIGKELSPENRERYIEELLEHDLYLGEKECKDYGIINMEEEENIILSDERQENLQKYVEKLFKEQKKEDEQMKKEQEEKKHSKVSIRKRKSPSSKE